MRLFSIYSIVRHDLLSVDGLFRASRVKLSQVFAWALLLTGLVSASLSYAMTGAEADMIDAAAQRGSPSAQVLLAVIYQNGMAGHTKNASLAAQWFERAAQQGNDYAQTMLADMYESGRGVPKNSQLAADWREKAARRGNVQAQFLLGKMYLEGTEIKADPRQAAYWLNRAAAEGDHSEARRLLAQMRGENAAGNQPALDANPLAQSAQRSYADAAELVQFLESMAYKFRESLYKRPPELEKLARDGDADAQYQLALRYETGTHDLPQDYGLALFWFKSAAQNGHPLAMKSLANIYQKGLDGVAIDPKAARDWREKSLSQTAVDAAQPNPLRSGTMFTTSVISDALGNDLVSFILSAIMLIGYQLFLWHKTRQDPTYTIQAINNYARRAWVETIMRGKDQGVLAVQTLRNSTMAATFLASTAVLLIIGVLTLSGQGDKLDNAWHALNTLGAKHAELRIGKLLILLVDLFIAFFSFAMSVRIYNHVGYMINVPLTLQHPAISPIRVAAHLNSGGKFYSIGMRAYYYAVPLVFWLFGPHFMLVATVVLIVFLFHLDHAPKMLSAETTPEVSQT